MSAATLFRAPKGGNRQNAPQLKSGKPKWFSIIHVLHTTYNYEYGLFIKRSEGLIHVQHR